MARSVVSIGSCRPTSAFPSQMRFQVRSGGDDMPAFDASKISDDDLEALVAYTVTLGAVEPSL